jgi:hypothetical protein
MLKDGYHEPCKTNLGKGGGGGGGGRGYILTRASGKSNIGYVLGPKCYIVSLGHKRRHKEGFWG